METVEIEVNNHVQIVRLNRPKALNAFNSQLMDDLADAFLMAAEDSTVRVLVLTGNGRAFSAGADLAQMGQAAAPPKHGLSGLLDAIVDFPKPFLLAVNGLGVGIGATICGLADFTYMAESARLRCPFSALGLTAEAGSTLTLPLLMGRQRANWLLLAAEWMSSAECLEAGLALEVLPDDNLMLRVLEQASKLAGLPPSSVRKTKELMMSSQRDLLKQHIRLENQGLAELTGSPANIEAITAFIEKRDPDFSKLE